MPMVGEYLHPTVLVSSTDICMALANVAVNLCVESDQTDSFEALLASRLIPLNKKTLDFDLLKSVKSSKEL